MADRAAPAIKSVISCTCDDVQGFAAAAGWTRNVVAAKQACIILLASQAISRIRRFEMAEIAPGIPLHALFQLKPSTYWLNGSASHDIGNMLLDLLCTENAATITKVNHVKFSIKANIYVDGSECTLKLRMYSDDARSALALEVQRRSGCAVVFNRFYQQVGEHIATRHRGAMLSPPNIDKGCCSSVLDSVTKIGNLQEHSGCQTKC